MPVIIWSVILSAALGILGWLIKHIWTELNNRIEKLEAKMNNGINSKISELETRIAVIETKLEKAHDPLITKINELLKELE